MDSDIVCLLMWNERLKMNASGLNLILILGGIWTEFYFNFGRHLDLILFLFWEASGLKLILILGGIRTANVPAELVG